MTIVVNKEQFLDTYRNYKLGLRSFEKYRYLFPIFTSPTLARVIADITSDGHLGERMIQFISKNKEEVIDFKERIFKLFKFKGRLRHSPSNPKMWECIVLNGPICRILKLCGAPMGNKVLKRFGIPKWIIKDSNEIKANYIRGLFDGEGSIISNFKNRNRIRIMINLHKEEKLVNNLEKFLNQIRLMLKSLGIKTTNLYYTGKTARKDGKITLGRGFEIQGTKNNLSSILNFRNYINFGVNRKAQILNDGIEYLMSIASAG